MARGSATLLFTLVFAVGIVVTVFLSNDASAVVLTPAVAAVVKAAEAKDPLPFLFICAFVAKAASFVLPISNPANLIIYGSHTPPLMQWLPRYALPSVTFDRGEFGAANLEHVIQCANRNDDLRLLACIRARTQRASNHAFVSTDTNRLLN